MMYAQDKQHVPDRVELKGILSEFRDALEEEIDKIKKSGQSSTLLFGGRQIESHGADLWYRFNVEYVPSLPADTPCKLVIGKDQFDGNLTGKHIVCREDVFNDYFMADIHSFKKRLIVYSAFMTEARLSTLLPAFSDAVRAGKQIIVVTKALSDRGKSELAQYQKCEKELRDIGVSVLHKKGMHEKLIFVDSNAVWIGSLNALSFTGLTGEVMQRHADRELTAEYEKLFDIEHICNAIENTYEQKCPICGDEMIVKESDEGGIYWQCVAGDYSRNVAQQYPLDGILRCKCGAPYVFAMKNEPRWVCSEDSRHYQKMRESDLKLEKMAALIPTKAARSQVNKYFFAKKKEIEAKKKATAPKKTSATKKSSGKSKSKDDPEQIKMF